LKVITRLRLKKHLLHAQSNLKNPRLSPLKFLRNAVEVDQKEPRRRSTDRPQTSHQNIRRKRRKSVRSSFKVRIFKKKNKTTYSKNSNMKDLCCQSYLISQEMNWLINSTSKKKILRNNKRIHFNSYSVNLSNEY
jgi:hypothetical protein